MRRTFNFAGNFVVTDNEDLDAIWYEHNIVSRLLSDESNGIDAVAVKVNAVIDPEAIRSASDVLKAVAPTCATEHDKQILEVAAGILSGVGSRKQ